MLEAFYLNTFFLFIQILISLFLIWLCDREDEDDDVYNNLKFNKNPKNIRLKYYFYKKGSRIPRIIVVESK